MLNFNSFGFNLPKCSFWAPDPKVKGYFTFWWIHLFILKFWLEWDNIDEVKGTLSGLRKFLATESPLKVLFISPQKLFSFSRYLSCCLDFMVMYQYS